MHQPAGERNYHIFYQLLEVATADERKALRLPATAEEGYNTFHYLDQSGCTTVPNVDDTAE